MQDQITAHLKEHGPSTVKELKLALGGSDTTIRKHLKALSDADVVSSDDGKYTLVSHKPKGPSRSHEQAQARDDAVLSVISKEKEATTAEVAKQVGISESLAYVSIWRLQKQGKVRKVGGRPAAYAAA